MIRLVEHVLSGPVTALVAHNSDWFPCGGMVVPYRAHYPVIRLVEHVLSGPVTYTEKVVVTC